MSRRKAIERRILRVCTPDEKAFTDTLAAYEAMLRLGFALNEVAAGFFSRRKDDPTCHPSIVIRQGERAHTLRLDQHKMLGVQAKCEERWHAWLGELLGNRPDETRKVMGEMFLRSRFTSLRWKQQLLTNLAAYGIVPTGPSQAWPTELAEQSDPTGVQD